ncbi:hypothetical protein K2173_010956 [Erythroxylum novogranatense]|uniref:Uncharacterized protein n=1 Tax=Erythroxylum novogranatense TaxID=1862640 RepID=A0AAV8T1G2_9ROSI|nr:hypothetical protein K2173_010956 [Erythroxylum novogranatense]
MGDPTPPLDPFPPFPTPLSASLVVAQVVARLRAVAPSVTRLSPDTNEVSIRRLAAVGDLLCASIPVTYPWKPCAIRKQWVPTGRRFLSGWSMDLDMETIQPLTAPEQVHQCETEDGTSVALGGDGPSLPSNIVDCDSPAGCSSQPPCAEKLDTRSVEHLHRAAECSVGIPPPDIHRDLSCSSGLFPEAADSDMSSLQQGLTKVERRADDVDATNASESPSSPARQAPVTS